MASELEPDLSDIVDMEESGLFNFNNGVPNCYWIYCLWCTDTSLTASLKQLGHQQNVAGSTLFYKYHFGWCSSWQNLSFFQILVERGFTGCMIFLSPFLKNVCPESFFSQKFVYGILSLQHVFLWIEAGLSPSKKVVFIFFNEIPSKMMKNAFYFLSKALMFTFLFWLCSYVEKRLDRKA